MGQLRVRLRLPDPRPEDRGSTVRLVLRDTSMADALHPAVAEATAVLDPADDHADLVLDVPDGALDPRGRFSLWVHVDRAGGGELRAGDLITTQNVPVTVDDLDGAPLAIPLTRI